MVTVDIPAEFGYVLLVIVLAWVLVNWLGLKVVQARVSHGVKYPTMYSDKDPMFNCVQRAHQNTLEAYPTFLVLLIFGGLMYPMLAAGCGLLWIVSRVVYAKGYYTGDPEKRNRGAFGYIGLLALLGCTISFALHLLGVL